MTGNEIDTDPEGYLTKEFKFQIKEKTDNANVYETHMRSYLNL